MTDDIFNLRKKMKTKLKESRYEHTLSVSFICASLAMRYGESLEDAETAGLLHDCAKHYDEKTLIEKCERKQIFLTEDEKKAPIVIHAIYGAWLAKEKYHVKNEAIISAIRYHTTGRPEMTLLEKIVFTSDYIEPRRDKAPDLARIRQLAYIDIDEAVYEILKASLIFLDKKECFVDRATVKSYEYYKKKHESDKHKIR